MKAVNVLGLLVALACLALPAAAAPARPALATLAIPGDPRFVAIARDVLLVQTAETPDFASQSGLIDDAMRVPSFAPATVTGLHVRLQADLAGLRALPWRSWSVDRQIDVRWIYATAERIDRELTVEKIYLHRPGAWLETTANDYIAILTYAPERKDALAAITALVPGMVDEMSTLCVPTQADVRTAKGLADGIISMLRLNNVAGGEAAIASLTGYEAKLTALTGLRDYAVIGAENYAWRLRHAELLPWTPAQLLELAQRRVASADRELAILGAQEPPPVPDDAERDRMAEALDQASLLALYDRIQVENEAAIKRIGFVTIPSGVGPIHARVTPDAMVPLTGDGGSMNPPPPFIPTNVGLWNVEHFDPKMPLADRRQRVGIAFDFKNSAMGPYAAHEGLPGHHLQLSIARLNADPIRNLLMDPVQNEGWALYAEQEFWETGGLGPGLAAHVNTLRSARFRMRRVVYDVNIETGVWDLQRAADWKANTAPGMGKRDADLLRSINWPTQLICYFSGKEQILALKADYKRKLGSAYTERGFNDALLAMGSVPYVFARAKMLGEPVPGF